MDFTLELWISVRSEIGFLLSCPFEKGILSFYLLYFELCVFTTFEIGILIFWDYSLLQFCIVD